MIGKAKPTQVLPKSRSIWASIEWNAKDWWQNPSQETNQETTLRVSCTGHGFSPLNGASWSLDQSSHISWTRPGSIFNSHTKYVMNILAKLLAWGTKLRKLRRCCAILHSTCQWATRKKQLCMRLWRMTLEAPVIGITVRMATHLRLESVVCRWKPLNVHNVVFQLVVTTIGLLVVLDLRRTWSVNSAELEFDIRDMETKSGGNDADKHRNVFEPGICLL